MRRTTWQWAAALLIMLPSTFLIACGDDSPADGGGGEGGTGGAGGDGGGGGVDSNDTCEGATGITVAADTTETVEGSIAGANDDYETFCADSETATELSYADVTYAVTFETACTATLGLENGDDFDGVLGFRTVACDEDEYCANASAGEPESIQLHVDAGTYSIIVSDASGGSGDFLLSVECATPACGDGVVNPTEECDDGNTEPDDGCDPECAFEASDPALDTCAGAAASDGIAIGDGESILVPAAAPERTTVGATDSGTGTCQTGQVDPAPDHVYKVIPAVSGTLTATVGNDFQGNSYCGEGEPTQDPLPPGCWDRAVHIREAVCNDSTEEVGCMDSGNYWLVETATAEVEAGVEYFVFVDGYNNDQDGQGIYVLELGLLQ